MSTYSEPRCKLTSVYLDFQDKVDIIPALTDANRALRLEKKNLDKALEETKEQLKEIDPLRQVIFLTEPYIDRVRLNHQT